MEPATMSQTAIRSKSRVRGDDPASGLPRLGAGDPARTGVVHGSEVKRIADRCELPPGVPLMIATETSLPFRAAWGRAMQGASRC